MPITCPTLSRFSQKDFAELDYCVMRHAFDCHNQLGRLCDESIYQNDLAARLESAGIPVLREARLAVTHRDFMKSYRLDLIVANAWIYELKTDSMLIGEHEAQLLNCLFLCDCHHGKLINWKMLLRSSSTWLKLNSSLDSNCAFMSVRGICFPLKFDTEIALQFLDAIWIIEVQLDLVSIRGCLDPEHPPILLGIPEYRRLRAQVCLWAEERPHPIQSLQLLQTIGELKLSFRKYQILPIQERH
jgi:GxxExxY protein